VTETCTPLANWASSALLQSSDLVDVGVDEIRQT
jgi:hypothetical protein